MPPKRATPTSFGQKGVPVELVANAIGDALREHRLGGRVSARMLLDRDACRIRHEPSGFVVDYDGWMDPRGVVWAFCQALTAHLLRDEIEAVEAYQEPHLVRL